ncbi:MAG: DNA repair protein RecN [Candidatus Neomarinimicrobiota bacterium]|jgi:DNA repair protein RecN (Recombination protein N)|nr:DNA repair protein RecN [Candidatus Neomarinimicrobiota bacterium]MDD3965484.1 DNA repair protein RecN [Candidatus Neomarinimicrobiota bacterium]MDX9780615.1 DNA repair protein RecN [bacterium]
MLRSLNIENIAIIQSLRLEPGRGLSILTGETGTGKSILIDALGLALGSRADLNMLRHNTKKAVVEALFDNLNLNGEVRQVLNEAGLEYAGGDVLIRRELHANGKSRAFFNDELIPLSALKILASSLVEMHGQHENQKLFKPKNHLLYLGKCAADHEPIYAYREAYQHFRQLLNRYRELEKHRESYLRERELREFHFRELDAIKPEAGELEKMEQELSIMENRERLAAAADQIARTLYEDDEALIHQIEALKKVMQQLLQIDAANQDNARELQSALISLSEVGRSMAEYRDNLEHDPARLASLQERTAAIHYQLRKHHKNYPELCEYYEQLKDEMSTEADYDTRLELLRKSLEDSRTLLAAKAVLFHRELVKTAEVFTDNIEKRLHLLGMKHARFKVDFRQKPCEGLNYILFDDRKVEPTINGIDEVEFLIITNPGDDFKPLVRIASGGEVSRIMLAIKSVLARHDETPTLIFDEIDAGVSGRIAHVVGEQIRELAQHHQILCITHLPQIAAMGERHFRVDKSSSEKETFAEIRELNAAARVEEIAALFGGKEPSEAGRKTAEELLKQS